jgi:macrolide-specific efflux system membrane fusion protein
VRYLKRFWWIILLGLLVGGGWLMWRSNEVRALKDKSYTVKRTDLTEALSLSGEIDALEKADLKFQTSGLLAWVGVKEGDHVKKYQAIASLDKRELANSLNQYMNSFLKERWDFEQGVDDNKDWQTNGMSDAARDTIKRTLDKNQFDLNNSVLAYEAKNLALKFATLTTPFEGIITHLDVPQPGTNVTPAGAVFSVVNPQTLFFSATADQTEVTSFSSGMKGEITLDSFPEQTFVATIDRVGFVPKEGESGTVYQLSISFDPGTILEKIKMGMTGDASFTFKELKNILAIPEAYIKKEKDKYFVSKMVNGQLEQVEVVQGEIIEGMVEIKEGLNENDVIYNQP